MNWRTDKPTADVIIAKVTNRLSYCVLTKGQLAGYTNYVYVDEMGTFVEIDDIEKWADLEEDETVTDCNELLEDEINKYINTTWSGGEKVCKKHIEIIARHFARWGAEHRDRFLNWIRDLIKKGIEKPEEALNILKRIDALINDDSLWGEHLKK